MKKLAIFLIASLLTLSCFGANARGLIVRNGPDMISYPVPSMTIMLRNDIGQNIASPAITGIDGMYYFYGIYPGMYYLDIYQGNIFVGRFLIEISNTLNVPGVFSDIPLIVIR